jgi:hypothetical protein
MEVVIAAGARIVEVEAAVQLAIEPRDLRCGQRRLAARQHPEHDAERVARERGKDVGQAAIDVARRGTRGPRSFRRPHCRGAYRHDRRERDFLADRCQPSERYGIRLPSTGPERATAGFAPAAASSLVWFRG